MNMTKLKQGSLNGLRRQTNECLENAYRKGYEDGMNEPRKVKAVNVEDTSEYQIGYKTGYDKGYYEGYDKCLHSSANDDYEKGKTFGYNSAIYDYNMMIEWINDCDKDFVKFLFEIYGLSSCRGGIELLYDLICSYDMAEVIDNFKKWQEEKKKAKEEKKKVEEEIKVGDVVKFNEKCHDYNHFKSREFLVLHIFDNELATILYDNGDTGTADISLLDKTSRRIDEVEQLLDKLRGEDNEILKE